MAQISEIPHSRRTVAVLNTLHGKMLKYRSKSVDLHLEPEDSLFSNYTQKTNFLCGIYKKEVSSSIFYTRNASKDRYVVIGEESIRNIPEDIMTNQNIEGKNDDGGARRDDWRLKKYSTVMKRTVLSVRTVKHNVTVGNNSSNDNTDDQSNEGKNTRTVNEKYSQGNNQEYDGKNIKTRSHRQICQSKHFPRKYLKTKKVSGSLGELSTLSNNQAKISESQICIKARLGLKPVLCRAIATKDYVPSPYDKQGLPFRAGDKISVTEMNMNGIWRGYCHGREGNFKFIDVKAEQIIPKVSHIKQGESIEMFSRSKSVSDLLSSISLEKLTPVFVLNGYDTTEDIQDISEGDLEYLGIADQQIKAALLKTISCLNTKIEAIEDKNTNSDVADSGISSSEDSSTSTTDK